MNKSALLSLHCPFWFILLRISVRVSGGESKDSRGGLGGLGLGLAGDLGTMSFESPCELRDKTSAPFSNRTMFETEEVRRQQAHTKCSPRSLASPGFNHCSPL